MILTKEDMKEIEKLIKKYSNGIDIHERMMNNPKLSPTEKNRHSYLKIHCETIVDDLKNLKKSFETLIKES